MSIEISPDIAWQCADALDFQAQRQDLSAEEAQQKADQGVSDDLIYDYAPVAQILRDNARRNRQYRDHLISLLQEED